MSRPENGDGGFLNRWARRKQEAQRATPAVEPPAAEVAPPAPPAEDLPLPSLDDIVPGSDVSAFFQTHVPDALRKQALRKLWVTDPEISGFIEMADYQWDFNNPDGIPGWGSQLDTTAIGRMAGRILGGGSPPEQTESPGETPESVPASLNSQIPVADAAEQEQAGPQPGDGASLAAQGDGAVQKTLDQTVVYTPARKRHGGALPS